MKSLNKFVKWISKIFEIVFLTEDLIMIIILILSAFSKNTINNLVKNGMVYGRFEIFTNIPLLNSKGISIENAVILAALSQIIFFSFLAMIFRNIYIIFKNSEKNSPFVTDNVKLIKQIGLFAIIMPIVRTIVSVIGRLIIGVHNLDFSISLESMVFGITVLCLSHFFAYGAQLQEDVDGLL